MIYGTFVSKLNTVCVESIKFTSSFEKNVTWYIGYRGWKQENMEHRSREWCRCTQLQFFCLKIQLNPLMLWNVHSLVVSEGGAFISNVTWGLWYVPCLQIATVGNSVSCTMQRGVADMIWHLAFKLFISLYGRRFCDPVIYLCTYNGSTCVEWKLMVWSCSFFVTDLLWLIVHRYNHNKKWWRWW
jgi:hypothetical protein